LDHRAHHLASRGPSYTTRPVQRIQDNADRRYTRICVTEKVDRYVENMEVGAFGRLATALGTATSEQRRTICDGLALLRQLLS
jgi:DNA-binding MarR family transcriptional regulator